MAGSYLCVILLFNTWQDASGEALIRLTSAGLQEKESEMEGWVWGGGQ